VPRTFYSYILIQNKPTSFSGNQNLNLPWISVAFNYENCIVFKGPGKTMLKCDCGYLILQEYAIKIAYFSPSKHDY
jgi:hypothetical protein